MIALLLALSFFASDQTPARPRPKPAPAPKAAPAAPAFFTSPLSPDEMTGKQAVVETSMGRIVIDLLPEAAPNHVGYVITQARAGAFDGTTFHRLVRLGIIQGGDPLSKDPARAAQYGTGGLGVLKAEISGQAHTRGTVSAVLQPGRPDSAGQQFFICIVDQPSLDGHYTVFGRVSEGILVAQKISEAPADDRGVPASRIEIRTVTIRDTPAEAPEPFSTASVADLARYRVVLETTAGPITVEFAPDKAPTHVRNFLRLAEAGVYDRVGIHRVARGFVIQMGSLNYRAEGLDETQQKYVRTLPPEFNDIRHVKGTVSMARGDDPASASTSFFIVLGDAPSLDGQYTAFGRVASGMEVVERIEAVPVNGEMPVTPLQVVKARVEKR